VALCQWAIDNRRFESTSLSRKVGHKSHKVRDLKTCLPILGLGFIFIRAIQCIVYVGRFSPFLQATKTHRVSRGIALLFSRTFGTRWGWGVSLTSQPPLPPGKDPVPVVQEAGWGPGPVWTGGKSRPHRDSIPERPTRSQSLYRLSYRALYCIRSFCN